MASKKQLETENQELKIKLEVEKHRKGYIHIPFSWPGVGRIALLLLSIALAVGNFILILSTWKLLDPFNESTDLLILYPLIGEFILVALTSIYLVAVIKGGFNKIKSYKEEGLIRCTIWGLILGLFLGLLLGFIAAPIEGLFVGLIMCLIMGLTGGLIFGLITGFAEEFS